MQKFQTIDSHTAGEPTRVVLSGFPDLGTGTLSQRREILREQFDAYRSAIVNEPRGSDVLVGAVVVPPSDPTCTAGVIFFNNVGYLGMCGHGMIGLAVTLGHAGRLAAGTHHIETPVGVVTVEYDGATRATIENVPSFRVEKSLQIDIPDMGTIVGDVAWGGNWFFLVNEHSESVELANLDQLTLFAMRIREILAENGVTGWDDGEIDHIEIFGPPLSADNHSRNFVLCPGGAFDRSPCGTGTSAKLACLYSDGKLKAGDVWRQEGILGTVFEGSVRIDGKKIIPRITGEAFITAESTLLVHERDPFAWGIR